MHKIVNKYAKLPEPPPAVFFVILLSFLAFLGVKLQILYFFLYKIVFFSVQDGI